MRIDGQWLLCDDGILRPVLEAEVLGSGGLWIPIPLQIDTGADCTVFDADTLRQLQLQTLPPHELLGGVGGSADSVCVDTQLRFKAQGGSTLVVKARFAAFAVPTTLDMSVLGRDITNLFALVVDRPGDVVCLLGQRHRYVIESS